MESKDYNAVSFGGFFVNNFALLRDLEGLTFQITKDDIHKFFDTEYNARVGGPADLLVMKVEERGYYACSDGKSMIISPVNIHDKPFGHSYLGFSMGVQQWLYELLPSFLTSKRNYYKVRSGEHEKRDRCSFQDYRWCTIPNCRWYAVFDSRSACG